MQVPLNNIFRNLVPYVAGEQPSEKNIIKLNTNENPFPIPKKMLDSIKKKITGSISRYPDPQAINLRKTIGNRYGFSPEWIFAGNGSDEILRLCINAFSNKDETIVFPYPSYPLYETLSIIADRKPHRINLKNDFSISDDFVNGYTDSVKIIANPDSPSGHLHPIKQIKKIAKKSQRVFIIDEAYVDFAKTSCLPLVKDFENIIVVRSFSKSFSLAGMRIGYCFGNPYLISALLKIKDSYNLNTISQIAGIEAMKYYRFMQYHCRKIAKNKNYLKIKLEKLGFYVVPSSANFILVKPSHIKAKNLYETLKQRKILVRYFDVLPLKDYLRISIGSMKEIKSLLLAIKKTI